MADSASSGSNLRSATIVAETGFMTDTGTSTNLPRKPARFRPVSAGMLAENTVIGKFDYSDKIARHTLIGPPPLPGDTNGDGFVGGDDLATVLDNWGLSGATRRLGDLDGDGSVGGADYTEVVAYWGSGTPPEVIPEPATLGLMLVGGLAMCRMERKYLSKRLLRLL